MSALAKAAVPVTHGGLNSDETVLPIALRVIALTMKLFSEFDHALIYPSDHKLGMRVPLGGSDCAKCRYVRNHGRDCAEPHFQSWNGSDKLPAPADEYCCDFFEAKEKFKTG